MSTEKLGLVLVALMLGVVLMLILLGPGRKPQANEPLMVSCDPSSCVGKIVLKNALVDPPPPTATLSKEGGLTIGYYVTHDGGERVYHHPTFYRAELTNVPKGSSERSVSLARVGTIQIIDPTVRPNTLKVTVTVDLEQ